MCALQHLFDNEAPTKNIPDWLMYLGQRLATSPVLTTLAPLLLLDFSNKLKLPQKYARRGFFHKSSLKNIPSHLLKLKLQPKIGRSKSGKKYRLRT